MKDIMRDEFGTPKIVDRSAFQAELDALRVREKAHTLAIAAARRRLPMVEVDPTIALIGAHGPVTLLDTFEGEPAPAGGTQISTYGLSVTSPSLKGVG